jgi:uncharacterized repeat protein (TIGR01451 family)
MKSFTFFMKSQTFRRMTLARSWVIGIRIICMALFIALAGQVLQPARTFAAGETITLTPSSGAVGSTFTITGSGFTTSPVSVFFNGNLLGSASVVNGSLSNATFHVPNVAAAQYNVVVFTTSGAAMGFSNGATFTVTGAGTALGNLGLSKFVQTASGFNACANGGGCTVQNTAGATETYAVQYQNTANAAIGQLTITDTLQSGQLFVSASSGCVAGAPAPGTGLVTVTCTVNNVPASPLSGSTNHVLITTRPASGFTGVLTNQACATEAGFVGQACSNTTYLTVSGNVVSTGTQICGLVSAFTAPSAFSNTYGQITIGGQSFTIAPTAQITGTISTAAPSNNVCITFAFVNQAATVLTVTPNLASANVVCGVLTVFSTTTSTITVGGIAFPATSTVMGTTGFVLGQTFCFLVQNNTIVGVLTGIPTAAHVVAAGGYHRSQMMAE